MTALRPLALFVGATLVSPAGAQVLHEKVMVGTLTCSGGICRSPSGEARAIEQGGQLLYAPQAGPEPKPGEQIYAPPPDAPVGTDGTGGGPPADAPPERRDVIRADRDTGPEGPGTHYYHAVFNPEPFPYKRMTVLDAVRDDEALTVHDRAKRPLVVTRERGPGRDLFWASVVIDLEPGRWVPLPSPAADSRVLEYKTVPAVPVEFARDSADNVYVRSPAGGRHRLTWLSDGALSYFGGALPDWARLSDVPRALRRPVPEKIRRRAQKVLAKLGLKWPAKSARYAAVLEALVAHFRAFEVGTLPAASESAYLDLALSQKGSCRHRSFAFVITALAVGIPARYVENELHVFVEVYVPGAGWRRVNLGGAPIDEEIVGADGRSLHRVTGEDPLPQPPAFLGDAGVVAKNLDKLARDEARAGRGGDGARASGGEGARASGAGPGYGEATGDAAQSIGAGIDLEAVARADEAQASQQPRLLLTRITVDVGGRDAFRGDRVEVFGAVTAEGGGGDGLPVEIYLDRPGGAALVGQTVTGADGRYRLAVEVPPDLPLGDHRVVARSKGDERRAPCSTARK